MFRSRIHRGMELLQRTVHKSKAAEKLSVAADSPVHCTQATTTAGEQSVPLIIPTCVQIQIVVRAEKTTVVMTRTARRMEVFGRACR